MEVPFAQFDGILDYRATSKLIRSVCIVNFDHLADFLELGVCGISQ